MEKYKVGILGATGMVGQRFISLLEDHPWFEVTALGASPASAGKKYGEVMSDRWSQQREIPSKIKDIEVWTVEESVQKFVDSVDFVFSAFSADKALTRSIEEAYAAAGLPVVSNNSAHRWTEDVPMVIPEINPHHLQVIESQQKKRGWTRGFIVVKPNCSIQSYVPLLLAWDHFRPEQIIVSTYQAVSGAGKTLESWPEMTDNVIPFISGEEEKSEKEPLKLLGIVRNGTIENAEGPNISAQCIRVPVSDGHLATINIGFKHHPEIGDLISALKAFSNPIASMALPSAPAEFITYFSENDRPQSKLDRDLYGGMGISVGRIRPDSILDYKCVALSHNTVRGAAGGSVLNAELLVKEGYISK